MDEHRRLKRVARQLTAHQSHRETFELRIDRLREGAQSLRRRVVAQGEQESRHNLPGRLVRGSSLWSLRAALIIQSLSRGQLFRLDTRQDHVFDRLCRLHALVLRRRPADVVHYEDLERCEPRLQRQPHRFQSILD